MVRLRFWPSLALLVLRRCFWLRGFWLALCVRTREGGSGALMLTDLARALLMCVGGMWQTTASATQVQWRLPRLWRASSASCRSSLSTVSLCVLPRALLGAAPLAPAGMLSVGGVRACGVEGVGGAFGC